MGHASRRNQCWEALFARVLGRFQHTNTRSRCAHPSRMLCAPLQVTRFAFLCYKKQQFTRFEERGAPSAMSLQSRTPAGAGLLLCMLGLTLLVQDCTAWRRRRRRPPPPPNYGCSPGVHAIENSNACPGNANILNCKQVKNGQLCEGDGECGTRESLNNWYAHFLGAGPPPPPRPVCSLSVLFVAQHNKTHNSAVVLKPHLPCTRRVQTCCVSPSSI